MTAPVRIQLSRRKGFDLQAQSRAINGLPAVNCARPSKWGNPFHVGAPILVKSGEHPATAQEVVDTYRAIVSRIPTPEEEANIAMVFGGRPPPDLATIMRELRGNNLACWCKPGDPCHADVLLELANR